MKIITNGNQYLENVENYFLQKRKGKKIEHGLRIIKVEKYLFNGLFLLYRHYIMAPSKYNTYGSTTFPAISDALYEANETRDWNQVKKQISITAYLIQNVADTLKSVT